MIFRYLILIVILSFNFQDSFGQIDSLRAELKRTKIDSVRADLYTKIGYSYVYSNSDSLGFYAKKALALSKLIHYKKGEAFASLRYGQFFHATSDFATALDYFERALILSDSLHNDELTARINGNLANLYSDMHYTEMAFRYNIRAIELYDKLGNEEWSLTTRINLGSMYLKTNMLDSSAFYLSQCSLNNKYPIANILLLFNLAELNLYQNQLDVTDSLLRQVEFQLNSDSSLDNFTAYLSYLQSQYQLHIKNYKAAILFANKSIAKYKKIGDMDNAISVYGVLGTIYEEIGDFKNALYYFKESNAFKDSVFNKSVKDKFDFWSNERKQRKLAIESREKQLAFAKKEWSNKFLMALTAFLMVSIVGLSFTIRQKYQHVKVLKTQKQAIDKQNQELQHREEELNTLNEELTQSQEEVLTQRDTLFLQKEELSNAYEIIKNQNLQVVKRNMSLEEEVLLRTKDILEYNHQLEQYAFITAHNLRAPVARILGLTNLFGLTADKGEEQLIKEKLTNASQELDTIISDINQILHLKNDSSLLFKSVDLQEMISLIINNFDEELKKYNVKVETDGLLISNVYAIPEYLNSVILSLVNNAIKFRNSENPLEIRFRSFRSANSTVLEIADNGLGIDLEKHRSKLFMLYQKFHLHREGKGMGLFIVKTQLDKMGAGIEVDSTPMKGTLFRIYFPNPS